MIDPIARTQIRSRSAKRAEKRAGAIVPLFAILLPVLLIFAGFAVNLAYMQLVATELKITTDCAAHAGGRAMSVAQGDTTLTNIQKREKALADGMAKAIEVAQLNPVVGNVLSVGEAGSDSQIEIAFGRSTRANNGFGKYQFTELTLEQIRAQNRRPSSLAVTSNLELPMMFNVMKNSSFNFKDANGNNVNSPARHIDSFSPVRRSIATQIDRDIALVIDRSGSMLYYRDETALNDLLWDLYSTPEIVYVPGGYKYRYWRRWRGYWYDRGYHRPEDAHSSWQIRHSWDRYWENGYNDTQDRISYNDYYYATDGLYDRYFSNNVIYQIEKWENENHTLGTSYSSSEAHKLTSEMAKYCHDWRFENSSAPRYSRWWYLEQGVTAFLDVLDLTDQEELVSLTTFSSTATLYDSDNPLKDNYSAIRSEIASINPYGGTAVGDGMATGFPAIVYGNAARPFAAKTIVVLTDGVSNSGSDPVEAVEGFMNEHLVSVHTVTFTPGADQTAMQAVSAVGQGRHYHANDGDALVPIFEEIANNLPTILTE